MKYIIVLSDGMADEPLDELGGKTPLEAAFTPNLERLALDSEIGMVRTVPKDMSPGSDTANLSVLGYNPQVYYTGRSPLEALSIGVDMEETDVSFRCNLVTLSEEQTCYEDRFIMDHSSDEISTEDAAVLVETLKEGLKREGYHFYVGTSYRHLLIEKEGTVVELTPPHDILTKRIREYLPTDPVLRDMMEKSYDILVSHPLNIERRRQGKNPANSAWFWGVGTRPMLTSFEDKFGKKGVMVSAVDLLKGIAVGAGLHNITVEGANGGLYTNYAGKAIAAVSALTEESYDFAYIHVEAPDEMGHQGSVEHKKEAIEQIDAHIIGPVVAMLKETNEDFRMLVLPDHPTPVRLRTHTKEPVPYLLFDSRNIVGDITVYSEKAAQKVRMIEEGYTLIAHLFEGGQHADS